MIRDMLTSQVAYHFHTTLRLAERAGALGAAEYSGQGYGHGGPHELLLHLLRTAIAWRAGLETGRQPPPAPAEDYPDLAALRAGFERERAAWQALLGSMPEEQLAGELRLTSLRGDVWPLPVWKVVQQIVLHGMQHHSELAQLLTAAGQAPGDIDFIFYREGA